MVLKYRTKIQNLRRIRKANISAVVQEGGTNSTLRRAVAAFQYNALRQLLLPGHQQYLLWLFVREEGFLSYAKDKRAKVSIECETIIDRSYRKYHLRPPNCTIPNDLQLTKNTGRISSKQVGEALTTAQKNASKNGNSTAVACDANDADQVWPLFCYELSIGMDQEDKLINIFRRLVSAITLGARTLHYFECRSLKRLIGSF